MLQYSVTVRQSQLQKFAFCQKIITLLGPLLFAMYTSPVGGVVSTHNQHHHQYADYTKLSIWPFDLAST